MGRRITMAIFEVEVEFKLSHVMPVEAPGRDEAAELARERVEEMNRGAFTADEIEITGVLISMARKEDYIDPDRNRD
jgi:hypothetical protein